MAVRLGFVGAGYMGQLAHISRYAGLADVTLAALAEQRPGLGQRVGEAYGFEAVYPDHRAMLAQAKLDAVVAIAPFQLNAPLVADVLEAGLAVITEKPQVTTSPRGQELIKLAREMRQAQHRGEQLNLTEDEVAFYDALEVNDSAVKVLGDETLQTIARELVEKVRNSVSVDWTVRETARAQIRVMVKRILRQYGYPPDKQEKATQTVLKQAELLCQEWAT